MLCFGSEARRSLRSCAFGFLAGVVLIPASSWAAVQSCMAAATGPGGGQLLLILDHLSPCPPGSTYLEPAVWEEKEDKNVVITRDPQEFYELATTYKKQGKLSGTVILQNNVCFEPPFPAPNPVSMVLTVYDEATLQQWADSGFVPGFAQGIITPDTIDLADAVFDIDYSIQYNDQTEEHATFRVRRSDGAIGFGQYRNAARRRAKRK